MAGGGARFVSSARFNHWKAKWLLALKRATLAVMTLSFLVSAICGADDYPYSPMCIFLILFMLYRLVLWKARGVGDRTAASKRARASHRTTRVRFAVIKSLRPLSPPSLLGVLLLLASGGRLLRAPHLAAVRG